MTKHPVTHRLAGVPLQPETNASPAAKKHPFPLPLGQPEQIEAEGKTYTYNPLTGKYRQKGSGRPPQEVFWLFVFKRLSFEQRSGLPPPDGYKPSKRELEGQPETSDNACKPPLPQGRGGNAALVAAT